MDVVVKSAAVTTVESDNPNGEFEAVLSTEAFDRDDENLWADEWKQPLPARIHIDGDHGRSIDKTVGSAVPRIEDNRLIAKGSYAGTPYAQMVRQLVNEGHINSLSVTFAEKKNQKDDSIQRELLNAAFVAIPANPEAVVLASKSAKTETGLVPKVKAALETVLKQAGEEAAADSPTHDGMVQAIHDAAYQLGAECANAADPGADDGANKGAIFVTGGAGGGGGATGTAVTYTINKTSSSKDAGTPQESAEESAAAEPAAEKAAGSAAAEESADDDAATKAKVAAKTRAHAFLISKNTHP